MESLYILQLEDDKWYVGKTADITKRFEQHLRGRGSVWTQLYKPIRIAETRRITSIHDETNVTKDYMKKYGIENVRGGAYTQVQLSDDVVNIIRAELRGNTDACYTCGAKGHFANRCPKQEVECVWECDYCEMEFKSEDACLRHEEKCRRQLLSKQPHGSCYRCGRSGHWASDCYARSHKDGYDI